MRSRAVLLPTPGDPFQMKLWFDMFLRWENEVEKLYICYNSRLQKDVVDYVKKITTHPKVEWIYFDHMIEHGNAIKELVNACKEDYVMLAEDDGIIFKPGIVNMYFDRVEGSQGKLAVVSHRQSATPNIAEATRKHFNFWHHEAFFWPNFLFIKRECLLNTDQVFGSRPFKEGEYVKEIDWKVEGEVGNDTFVWASIQLRAQGLQFEYVDQFHSMPEDIYYAQNKMRAWNGSAHWVHLGSLSSVLMNFLFDDQGRRLGDRTSAPQDLTIYPAPSDIDEEGTKLEHESRIAATLLAYEYSKDQADDIADFRKIYGEALVKAIIGMRMRRDLIEEKIKIYKQLYDLA